MKLKIITGVCALSLSGTAFAVCPDNLSTEEMTECIMIEGSGDISYQQWQKDFHEAEEQSKTSPMVSSTNTGNAHKTSSVVEK